MKKNALLLILPLLLLTTLLPVLKPTQPIHAEAGVEAKPDRFFQYSIWWAFVNRVFEGHMSVAELKDQGDVALGSYSMLSGELIMLDGVPYKIDEVGKVTVAEDNENIVYANAAFFDTDAELKINEAKNYEELRNTISSCLPSKNYFYAFKIHGRFAHMKCGGLAEQTKPFDQGLDVLIPNRPIFELDDVSGTLVGFYCPSFIGNINVEGYHMHFISDDRKFGGHAIEFAGSHLEMAIDKMAEYTFALPESAEFDAVGFEKQFQYQQK